MQGRIIKQISNLYTVSVDGDNYECSARGKFRNEHISPLVGDIVKIGIDTLTIDEIMPRKNELKRPVVANVDTALIVTSVKKPDLSLTLLDKLIAIVTSNNIEPVICLTKLDLLNKSEKKEIKNIFKYYKKIGIRVITNNNRFIKRILKNKLVVLTGQTGAGKSSLLNRINKKLNIETHEISEALNRGVHTTRHTEIYKIGKVYFVDTPGFSSIDVPVDRVAPRGSARLRGRAVLRVGALQAPERGGPALLLRRWHEGRRRAPLPARDRRLEPPLRRLRHALRGARRRCPEALLQLRRLRLEEPLPG